MARTAFVFVDELQAGKSQILFGKEPYKNPNFQVIEVDQSLKGQQITENKLLIKVRKIFPQAIISRDETQTFITNPN